MSEEIQIYEIHVLKDEANVVFYAIETKLKEAKAAGRVISASWTRRSVEKGQIE